MHVRRAYCSAVDRVVPVVLKTGAAPRDHVAHGDPADLICLDYKVRCTGWCCPLFSVEDNADDSTPTAPTDPGAGGPSGARTTPARTKSRWTRRT